MEAENRHDVAGPDQKQEKRSRISNPCTFYLRPFTQKNNNKLRQPSCQPEAQTQATHTLQFATDLYNPKTVIDQRLFCKIQDLLVQGGPPPIPLCLQNLH